MNYGYKFKRECFSFVQITVTFESVRVRKSIENETKLKRILNRQSYRQK